MMDVEATSPSTNEAILILIVDLFFLEFRFGLLLSSSRVMDLTQTSCFEKLKISLTYGFFVWCIKYERRWCKVMDADRENTLFKHDESSFPCLRRWIKTYVVYGGTTRKDDVILLSNILSAGGQTSYITESDGMTEFSQCPGRLPQKILKKTEAN